MECKELKDEQKGDIFKTIHKVLKDSAQGSIGIDGELIHIWQEYMFNQAIKNSCQSVIHEFKGAPINSNLEDLALDMATTNHDLAKDILQSFTNCKDDEAMKVANWIYNHTKEELDYILKIVQLISSACTDKENSSEGEGPGSPYAYDNQSVNTIGNDSNNSSNANFSDQ